MASTRNLQAIPSPRRVQDLCKSLSLLDEIVEPRWEFRFFSYYPGWYHEYTDVDVAEGRNGCGDGYHVVFAPAGVAIRGYTLHSALGGGDGRVYEEDLFYGLPPGLEMVRYEPSFDFDPKRLTFVIWRAAGDEQWRVGRLPEPEGVVCSADDWLGFDGSEGLLWWLDDEPSTYVKEILDDSGRSLDVDLVRQVYDHELITEELILGVNSRANVEEVMTSAEGMGFRTSRLVRREPEVFSGKRARCFSCAERGREDCPYEQGR